MHVTLLPLNYAEGRTQLFTYKQWNWISSHEYSSVCANISRISNLTNSKREQLLLPLLMTADTIDVKSLSLILFIVLLEKYNDIYDVKLEKKQMEVKVLWDKLLCMIYNIFLELLCTQILNKYFHIWNNICNPIKNVCKWSNFLLLLHALIL